MVRHYKRAVGSREYHNYSEESMNEAIEACKGGMSIREACERFGVKRGTLHNRLNGLHTGSAGGKPVLCREEETAIVHHLITLAEWGFPFDNVDLKNLAKLYLDKQGRTVRQFKNNYPGDDWCKLFLNRYKDQLKTRMCQNIKKNRAAVDVEQIDQYFENLRKSLRDVPEENIINYDETNLQDDPGRKKCIFKRGVKYPERIMNHTKSATSLMFAATASGHVLEPYVVYKSEHLWNTWTYGGPKKTRYNRTKSGWFDARCFEDWFQSVILPYCHRKPGKKILIGDNLSSHFSKTVIEACKENNISFACLPPNSTHLLQPLDVAYYGPMKCYWRAILTDWKLTDGRQTGTITKEKFPQLLKKLVMKLDVNGANNIRSGFRKCGICPLDSSVVKARLPQKSTESNQVEAASASVSECVTEMLSVLRSPVTEKKRQKRSRIDVVPGKSVSLEDFVREEGGPVQGPSGEEMMKAREQSDSEDGDDSDQGTCSAASERSEEAEEEILTKAQIEKGDWVVVQFSTKKSTKYFVGNVLSVLEGEQEDGDFLVSFMRRKPECKDNFVWPSKVDVSTVDFDQIKTKLPPPEDLRRGELLTTESRIGPNWDPEPAATGELLTTEATNSPTCDPEPQTAGELLTTDSRIGPNWDPEPAATGELLTTEATNSPTCDPEPQTAEASGSRQLRPRNIVPYKANDRFSSDESTDIEADESDEYVENSGSEESGSEESEEYPSFQKTSLDHATVTSASIAVKQPQVENQNTANKVGPTINGVDKSESQVSSSTSGVASVSSAIQVLSTNNNTTRVYDKRFYCLYCQKPQSKLPRHLLTCHEEELEVVKYSVTKDKEEKAKQICKLRNLGNHLHNSQVIKQKSGSLVVAYRTKVVSSWSDYVPCEFCLGYYVHWDLWKHMQRCPLKPLGHTKSGRVAASSRLLLPVSEDVSEGLHKLLASFHLDKISRVVKSDPLIIKLGEKLFLKLGHDTENFSTIRNTMRELGRIVIHLRESVGPHEAGLTAFINPLYFQDVVKSAKHVAGFCEETHLFQTPSLALKLGHSLRKCAKIIKGKALESGDDALLKQVSSFSELCDLNWTEEISTHALRTLGENKRNKVKLVPLIEDCELLSSHLRETGLTAYKALEISNSNVEAWCDLAASTLTQIILFNRRRQGEVSKMTLADLEGEHSSDNHDVTQALSPLEQQLCKVLTRVEIVGKRGRTVPVILTSDMKRFITMLNKTRNCVGVNPDNKYVFARAYYQSLGHIRGCDCLRNFSESCGAKFPKLLRSTKLRKQIATLSQLLNLKDNELDILANFLGHDVRVHREFYRLPEHTLQVAKVSKLLLLLESGQFSKNCGKTLQDISVEPTEELDMDVDEGEISKEDSSGEEELPSQLQKQQSSRSKEPAESSKGIKRPWTVGEKAVVMRHFEKMSFWVNCQASRKLRSASRKKWSSRGGPGETLKISLEID